MADRYFVESPISGPTARLAGAEAHHLLHVMRSKPGDRVTLFDGSGSEFAATITAVGRSEVELVIEGATSVDRELPIAIHLGVSLPKAQRQQWLVEKAVELGTRRLIPLETKRGVVVPTSSTLVRLRRQVIEASKQCGRNRLMEIAAPQPLADYLHDGTQGLRLFAHPGGGPLVDVLRDWKTPGASSSSVVVAIGPEGGFTDDEAELAMQHGWKIVSLGKRILRVETAAIMSAAVVAGLVESSSR